MKEIEEFLAPLAVDEDKLLSLASSLTEIYQELALHSDTQFLSTPIKESLLVKRDVQYDP